MTLEGENMKTKKVCVLETTWKEISKEEKLVNWVQCCQYAKYIVLELIVRFGNMRCSVSSKKICMRDGDKSLFSVNSREQRRETEDNAIPSKSFDVKGSK